MELRYVASSLRLSAGGRFSMPHPSSGLNAILSSDRWDE